MSKATRYSIWLMPEGGMIRERFQSIITELSGKYESPRFEPHVTLIGGVNGDHKNVIAKTHEIARKIRPFFIGLTDVGVTDQYFKTLFVMAKETPELIRANKIAQEIYGTEQQYMPHLSLLYGNFDHYMKEGIVDSLGNTNFSDVGFPVTALHLYKTEGNVWEWYEVAKFAL